MTSSKYLVIVATASYRTSSTELAPAGTVILICLEASLCNLMVVMTWFLSYLRVLASPEVLNLWSTMNVLRSVDLADYFFWVDTSMSPECWSTWASCAYRLDRSVASWSVHLVIIFIIPWTSASVEASFYASYTSGLRRSTRLIANMTFSCRWTAAPRCS